MSNAVSFVNSYASKIQQLVLLVEDLRAMNDMVVQDPTLVTRYFADAAARADIAEQDVTDAHAALVQILFTYDSGSPPQKAAFYKMLS